LEARTVRENAIRALAVALSDKTEDLTASKKVEVGGPWWQDVLSRAYARGLSE
jgi:hypothetical protein